jgi:3-hydroxyacyl-[acyl-carrier-protein] dehydratase
MAKATDQKAEWKSRVFFDPEDRIYADHFPGHPVVPGSMIVHAFLLAAEKQANEGSPCAIENFRFRKFISPGEYDCHIAITESGLRCTLYDGSTVAATGVLK